MARNRKHQSTAVRFAPALKVLLCCSFLVAAGVGYVWQKDQLVDLGRRKANLEGRLRLLREQAQQIERKLMALQSPASLESKVREFKLGLSRVESDKIIRLAEPSSDSVAAGVEASMSRSWETRRGGLVER